MEQWQSLKNIVKKIPGSRTVARKLGFASNPAPPELIPILHGPEGIAQHGGHRNYIGGWWEEIGKLQFDFLVSRGLKPHHYLCDVACGSLRAGIHFIRYLEPGHYMGIDKEQQLIDSGISQELGRDVYEAKRPQFVVSSDFEFEKFADHPDFALAQSLFTHLRPQMIVSCMRKLRGWIAPGGTFYATYFESSTRYVDSSEPDVHRYYYETYYTRDQMLDFGERTGWRAEYIGDWNHPAKQVMVKYTIA
jgi:SAM-dependent methyltransferase